MHILHHHTIDVRIRLVTYANRNEATLGRGVCYDVQCSSLYKLTPEPHTSDSFIRPSTWIQLICATHEKKQVLTVSPRIAFGPAHRNRSVRVIRDLKGFIKRLL